MIGNVKIDFRGRDTACLPRPAEKRYTPPMDTNNEPEKEKSKKVDDILWHPAFCNAIRLEFRGYENDLNFVFEHPLTTGPLKIDVMIIKKAQDAVIEKNIAEIFRGVNIVEYKSPSDHVSVRDFLKVYAYACLYASLEEDADITDMSLTFVENRYPRTLLDHLRDARGCTVEKKWPGIYIVSGDPLPIQIIDSKELSVEENFWLKGLSNTLDAQGWRRMLAEMVRLGKSGLIGAYFNAIMRANKESLREAYKMSDDTLAMDSLLVEIGLAAKWEARGEARGEAIGEARGISIGDARTENKILGLFKQGYTVEEVERMLAQSRAGNAEIPMSGQS